MKIFNVKQWEAGGSLFRSYVAVDRAGSRATRQIDLWLTLDHKWISFKSTPLSKRSADRYNARTDGWRSFAAIRDEAPARM